MFVSICVPTRNRPESLERMTHSILQSKYQNYEIIVVDNSDKITISANREILAVDKRIIHLLADRKIGIAALRQLAIENSHGDIVVCADDDIEVPDDWMSSVVRAFEGDPRLGIWGCQIINYDEYGMEIHPSFHGAAKAEGTNGAFHPLRPGEKIATFGEFNMALCRKAVFEVGGFDHRFSWGHEGADLAKRILMAGYKLCDEPGVTIKHQHSPSKSRPRIDRKEYLRLLYFFKYHTLMNFSFLYEIKRAYYSILEKNYSQAFWVSINLITLPWILWEARKNVRHHVW